MLKFDFSKLPDLTPLVSPDKSDMRAIGLSAVRRVVTDTTAGKSPSGGVFERYSPKYQLVRAARGRGPLPNLLFSGRMLRDFKIQQYDDRQVSLGFLGLDNRTKAVFHQYGFSGTVTKRSKKGKVYSAKMNLPARPFVGLSKENQDALALLLARRLEKKKPK